MSDIEAQLLEEYGGAIDSSTLLAILSDFDLSKEAGVESARQILDVLKASVPDDEASGFDASGASGPHIQVNEEEEHGESSGSGSGQMASQTDTTSVSHGMSSLDLDGLDYDSPTPMEERSDTTFTSQLGELGDEDKEKALMGIFPILKPFDVKWCLKKHQGDADLAIDELMNESFLEENGIRHKGIDAFSETDIPSRPRKGKAKGNKKKGRMTGATNSQEPESPAQSKWETAKHDVEFISGKIGMPDQQVSSIYHNSGGSVHGTLAAIIGAHKAMKIEDDDPMTQINAFELRQDYPAIPTTDLETLILLTRPSLANARELAKAFVSRPTGSKTPIQLEFRHAPLNLSDPSPSTPTKLKANPIDPLSANNITASYTNSRNSAFNAASAYYRKSKSDHLMGGAAAYYSQEGRSFHTLVKAAESDAADALVASQSSSLELDLHGVGVKDAVRISREKVTSWWATGARGGGYRVVTGIGHHSVGGRGRLGPAVGKMLVREGWKVEVLSGVLVVKGVVGSKKR